MPNALEKWSSTKRVETLRGDSSCLAMMALHVESPKALAKCSSTAPAEQNSKQDIAGNKDEVEHIKLYSYHH